VIAVIAVAFMVLAVRAERRGGGARHATALAGVERAVLAGVVCVFAALLPGRSTDADSRALAFDVRDDAWVVDTSSGGLLMRLRRSARRQGPVGTPAPERALERWFVLDRGVAVAALEFGEGRGGPPQRRRDLVGDDLEAALLLPGALALGRGPDPGPGAAEDDDPGAGGQALREVLGVVAPDRDRPVGGLGVLPPVPVGGGGGGGSRRWSGSRRPCRFR
jgi:hypothetical protein